MKLIREFFHKVIIFLSPSKFRKKVGTCEEMAIYLSGTPKLNRVDRLFVNLHLYICKNCRSFQAQIIKLDEYKDKKFKNILEKAVDEKKAQSIADKIKRSL